MAEDMMNFAAIDPKTGQVVATMKSNGLPNVGPNWLVEAPEGVVADYWLDRDAGLYRPGPSLPEGSEEFEIGEFAILNTPEEPAPSPLVDAVVAAADTVNVGEAPTDPANLDPATAAPSTGDPETAIARAKRKG